MKHTTLKYISAFVLAVCLLSFHALAAWEESDTAGPVGASLSSTDWTVAGSSECDLGSYAADAVRYSLGADAAIVNSGDLAADFPANVVTYGDIRSVFSDDRELAVAQVSAAQLCQLIEGALSHITVDRKSDTIDRAVSDFGGFPQLSGMKLIYDGSANPGERIYRLELSDGRSVLPDDEDTVITLAATEHMLSGGWGFSAETEYEPAGMSLSEAVADYIAAGDVSFDAGRIRAIGVNDNWAVDALPKGVLPVIVIALIVIFLVVSFRFNDIKFNVYYAREAEGKKFIRRKRR